MQTKLLLSLNKLLPGLKRYSSQHPHVVGWQFLVAEVGMGTYIGIDTYEDT
jgi:hypothetical protein